MPIDGKPIIGLLGAPGAGKSTVAAAFAEAGGAVIDADALGREALQAPEIRDQLVAWWGEGILTPEGGVSRKAVGDRVFNDAAALKQLEGLIHPWVNARRQSRRRELADDPDVRAIVEDSPLLIEKDLAGDCDALVFVDAPRADRLARLARDRGWSEGELTRRENQQIPLDTKRRRADYVIDNHADTAACHAAAKRVFSQLLHDRAL
jgi:dephospho-CoA kinase